MDRLALSVVWILFLPACYPQVSGQSDAPTHSILATDIGVVAEEPESIKCYPGMDYAHPKILEPLPGSNLKAPMLAERPGGRHSATSPTAIANRSVGETGTAAYRMIGGHLAVQ
jgi:hypothetical protein